MGFGVLFIGFFLAYAGSFTPLAVFTYVLGTGVILYSLKKLIFENKLFLCSAILAVLLELVSMAYLIMYVFGFRGAVIFNVLLTVQSILATVLAALLSAAIIVISRSLALTKIQAKATVDIAFIVLYLVSSLILSFVKSEAVLARLGLVSFILKILYVALSLFVIFNCYMRICYEGDENMQGKNSFAPFRYLNDKLNDAMDKGKDKKGKKK